MSNRFDYINDGYAPPNLREINGELYRIYSNGSVIRNRDGMRMKNVGGTLFEADEFPEFLDILDADEIG